jgi:hypothetical protein
MEKKILENIKKKSLIRYQYRILREEVLHYKLLINWRSYQNSRVFNKNQSVVNKKIVKY